jgi:hypothetical protein
MGPAAPPHIVETLPDGQKIRACYESVLAHELRKGPKPRVVLAFTSEGWMVTHDGARHWMHGQVFDGGVELQRLEVWREEHPELGHDEDHLGTYRSLGMRPASQWSRRALKRLMADRRGNGRSGPCVP